MHSRLKLIAFVVAVNLPASINAQPLSPEAAPLAAQAHALGQDLVGTLDYAVGAGTKVGVQWGRIVEHNALLGTIPGDAFSSSDAHARTLGVWASHRLGDAWKLGAQYSIALAAGAVSAANAVALGLLRDNALMDDDRLALTLSSSIAVTTTGAHIGLPTTITGHGEDVLSARRTAIATTSRELRLGFNYEMPLSRESSVTWVLDLNHNSNRVPRETDQRIGMILRTRF